MLGERGLLPRAQIRITASIIDLGHPVDMQETLLLDLLQLHLGHQAIRAVGCTSSQPRGIPSINLLIIQLWQEGSSGPLFKLC